MPPPVPLFVNRQWWTPAYCAKLLNFIRTAAMPRRICASRRCICRPCVGVTCRAGCPVVPCRGVGLTLRKTVYKVLRRKGLVLFRAPVGCKYAVFLPFSQMPYGQMVTAVWSVLCGAKARRAARKVPFGTAKYAVWRGRRYLSAPPLLPIGRAKDHQCPSAALHRPLRIGPVRPGAPPHPHAALPDSALRRSLFFRNCHYKPPSRRSLCPASLRAVRKLPWGGAQQIAV